MEGSHSPRRFVNRLIYFAITKTTWKEKRPPEFSPTAISIRGSAGRTRTYNPSVNRSSLAQSLPAIKYHRVHELADNHIPSLIRWHCMKFYGFQCASNSRWHTFWHTVLLMMKDKQSSKKEISYLKDLKLSVHIRAECSG